MIRRRKGSEEPDGGLEEAAFFASLGKVFGKLSSAENVAILKAGAELYASFGYTTVQEGRASPEVVATMATAAKAVSCSESEASFRLASHTLAQAGVATACNHAD